MKHSRPPNVIVYFTDQQRWDTTGVHDNPLGLTPNFDQVALQGTHIFNSFTCQPVCAPARASLQTGLYATNTGVYRNGLPLRPETKTLAYYFNQAGYHTGYIGKWHLADDDPVPPHQQGGYQYWLGANLTEFISEPYHTVLYDEKGQMHEMPDYRVDATTDAAIRYISDHQNEPFFLFLSFLEPHHQNHIDDFVPPEGYRQPYQNRWIPPDLASLGGSTHQHIAGYYGMVKRLDEAFGRLLDVLISLGLQEKTVVAFTSDHGCHFKTRNAEYKRSCHESSIRVPTSITGPGFTGGGRIQELVSLVDLPPTLLEAADIEVPEHFEGRSILPLIRSEKIDWPDEVFLQISESQIGRAVRTRRWKYSVHAPGKNGWDDSNADHYQEEFLYDLQADPYELHNRIGLESHQEVTTAMRQRLVRRMLAAGEKEPTIEIAPIRSSFQFEVSTEEASQ
jgi:arylsulfatase A-like enzyme